MSVSQADVATTNASRYLQQLCKHWSHKFPVEFTPYEGRIELPSGVTRLRADEANLHVEVETTNETDLERLETVVADHIVRFAFREDLQFAWHRAG